MNRLWTIYEKGKTLGQKGAENGIILKDEEYANSCRITLERCIHYCAITCGIHGSMVHTAFCDESNSLCMYKKMKEDLKAFIESDLSGDDELDFFERFTSKY